MVKSAVESFPDGGLALHVSAEDALSHGIRPGDPAVIEVTVRPFTTREWIAEGVGRRFANEADEIDFFGRCPVPGESAVAVPEERDDDDTLGGEAAAEEPSRITWTSGAPAARAEGQPVSVGGDRSPV